MNKSRRLIFLSLSIIYLAALATPVKAAINPYPGIRFFIFSDSLPKTIDDTVVVPFEYRQSTLNYRSTFRLVDSVIEILLSDELITFSVEGYAYMEEAGDSICYWLSFNRALAVKNYVIGRGIDSTRMVEFRGNGNLRSIQRRINKEPVRFNYTAEIVLNYPIPPPEVKIADMDEDGIPDAEDSCRDEYGTKARNGCPDRNAIVVPFELQQSYLFSSTYKVLDSVVMLLRNDPDLTIAIQGHAYKKEGVKTVCDRLSKERADISKRYLLTRRIPASRIRSVESFGSLLPLNAGRNPLEISRNARAEIVLLRYEQRWLPDHENGHLRK